MNARLNNVFRRYSTSATILNVTKSAMSSSRNGRGSLKIKVFVTQLSSCVYLPPPSQEDAERGKRIHDYLQAFVKRTAKVEYPIKKEFPEFILSGRIDVLLPDNTPLEIKSGLEHPEHFDQVRMYMNMLGVDTGYLYYYGRKMLLVEGRMSDKEIERRYELFIKKKLFGHCPSCKVSMTCPFSLVRV